jgi:sugar phosphate isomerase/epimerase
LQPLKTALQLKSLKLPFRKALIVAHELKVEAVEIDARNELRPGELSQTGVREIRKLLSDLGLKVAAIGFQTRRGYADQEDLEARIDATKAAMQMAYQLGAAVVVNQIGRVPAELASPEGQTLRTVLADLGAHGNKTGAWLAARTGTESAADLKKLLSEIPEGSIGVSFDPGGLIVNDFNPSEAVAELGPLVRYVQARDGVRDRAMGRGSEVTLGRGTADFPYLLAVLEDFGYRGYVCVEREHADDPRTEVSQALRYLKNLSV